MTPPDVTPPAPRTTEPWRIPVAIALVLLATALAAAAVVLGTDRTGAPPRTSSAAWTARGADPDRYAADLLAAAGRARTDAGLPAWQDATCAHPAALQRARDLVGGELTHAPLDPVLAACAPLTTAAENLSRAAAPPRDVVAAWTQSAGHRANLEDPTLTHATTACVLDDGQMLCALLLAGP